ncbi:putative Ig domain-containing protein [Micromonospora echinofusca]|uniref:Fibronectin type-III domain-containing protein n=1 Tax=Micromonospora echinofusca TaxID=47858 RepID=A0ABS3VU71_MICEH|nr:putative Ig domain-containing protein [Micromonospora echinofusca]MBO4208082.1 hypothetical protein [Micromonospora echinofusca]
MSLAVAGTLLVGVTPAAAVDGDPADAVVLTEDFSSGQLPAGWTSHLGTWQVRDGRLHGSSVSGQRARITFGTSHENYRLDATVDFLQVTDPSRWLNLAADFHGAEDYGSVFVVRSNTTLSNGLEYAVRTSVAGSYTSPTVAAAGVALGTDSTHALSLEVRGARATLSIDGVPYLSTNDLFRSNGTLGLVVNNATVAFDDIRVTRLAREATGPGEPTGLRVAYDDTRATLSWQPPAEPGTTAGGAAATVTGYQVAAGPAGTGPAGLTWTPAAGTSHTFAGLAPGAYTLWVRAVNSAGRAGEPAGANASPGVPRIKGFHQNVSGGAWPAGHVQGIAVDQENGFIYYSFTNLLVKTDRDGNVVGTVGGFTGHLGDLDFNETDGRVYGSLEYKAQNAFYIAIVDVDAIDRIGMQAQNSALVTTVHLAEVVADFTADLDGNGVFDGNTGDTPDHRYGSSGIDGVSFGPRFGETGGTRYLTVAYGVYANLTRTDNDHQVLVQYDVRDWAGYEQPLVEAAPHRSGPTEVSGKYFVRTGNTTYGVQNLAYDDFLQRWFLGVYAGAKPEFPNYTLFAVDAATRPVRGELIGTGGEQGLLVPLATDGLTHPATGIRGWFQKADVGIESLGDGLFYLARNGTRNGQQTADLTLYRWTGAADAPFAAVSRESELYRAPVMTSAAPPAAKAGRTYSHTFTASAFPKATFTVVAGALPAGLTLDSATGVLSGVPVRPGRAAFTVAAANGVDPGATQAVVIMIAPARQGPDKEH